MKDETKKKSLFIYLSEFVVVYIVVFGFLAVVFENRSPELARVLFATLIITTAFVGLAEGKK